MPPAENWLRFSCSIPPLFVLSHSLPKVNTMGKLALFWRFSITANFISSISLATGYRLMTTILTPHALTPHATRATYRRDQRGQAVRRPSRWLLHATSRRIDKVRTGPDLDERPSIFSMSPNQAIPAAKLIRFFPLAAAQQSTILTWPEALKATGSRRASRMAIRRNASSFLTLPDFPEFASAVKYGVPRNSLQFLSHGVITVPAAEQTLARRSS